MKKVLLVNHEGQQNASTFLKYLDQKKVKLDRMVILHPPKNALYYLKRLLRPVKFFFPSNLKKQFKNALCFLFGGTQLEKLFSAYDNSGMNSWDLLSYPVDILHYAKHHDISIKRAKRLESHLFFENKLNYIATYGGGRIPKKLTDHENLVFLNAHMGSMPRYRGMNVLEWAVLEKQPTEVTVLTMNEKIDGGEVCHTKAIYCSSVKDVVELRRVGYDTCAQAMAEAFELIENGQIRFEQQPEKGIRYYYRMHSQIRNQLFSKRK